MNLVELAAIKKLPEFQYLDKQTCDWIENNNPNFIYNPNSYISVDLNNLSKFSLPEEWFLEKRIINSLHGYRHMMRCVIYSIYFTEYLKIGSEVRTSLILASSLHDIRRCNDKDDEEHGNRSAAWVRENIQIICKAFGINLICENQLSSIEAAIQLHEIPYDNMNHMQIDKYLSHKSLTDLLKTSDALDRFRLPKLKWWIDDKYLKVKPPPWLKQIAFNCVLTSEKYFLDNNNNWGSIELLTRNNHADR
jgi:hypothetical protein